MRVCVKLMHRARARLRRQAEKKALSEAGQSIEVLQAKLGEGAVCVCCVVCVWGSRACRAALGALSPDALASVQQMAEGVFSSAASCVVCVCVWVGGWVWLCMSLCVCDW